MRERQSPLSEHRLVAAMERLATTRGDASGRRRNPPQRRRAFKPPVATATHPQDEVDRFMHGLRNASALLDREAFDFAVVQKWQVFPTQCDAEERAELRSLGDWLKFIGMHDEPKRLMRGAGVRGWDRGWADLQDADVVKYAEGFRSWSRSADWHDIFCLTEECAIFTWQAPPDALIVLDGNALRDWMAAARPELTAALDEAHGVVGLDGGEYIADAPTLRLVKRSRGVRRRSLHMADDRKFFSVRVAAP